MFLKIKAGLLILAGTLSLFVFTLPAMVGADNASDQIQQGIDQAAGTTNPSTNPGKTISDTIGQIINILSAIVGIAAVIMLIIAGFRFVTSGGSESGVKAARGSIIYAVVGLIIVALAQAVVHLVINKASPSG